MKHPPIPPDSKHWCCDNEGWGFYIPHDEHLYNADDFEFRGIIAACFEVEWRALGEDFTAKAVNDVNLHSKATECFNNARAWRAWGLER